MMFNSLITGNTFSENTICLMSAVYELSCVLRLSTVRVPIRSDAMADHLVLLQHVSGRVRRGGGKRLIMTEIYGKRR